MELKPVNLMTEEKFMSLQMACFCQGCIDNQA